MKLRLVYFFLILINSSSVFAQLDLGYKTLIKDGKLRKTEEVYSQVIAIIPAGTKVKLLEKAKDGYFKVKYGYYTGYLNDLYFRNINKSGNRKITYFKNNSITSRNYRSKDKEVTYSGIVILKGDGKLRKDNEVYSPVIKVVPSGEKVEILRKDKDGYYKVNYRGFIGYMNNIYFGKKSTYQYAYNYEKPKEIESLPPILSILLIDFSEKVLDAEETAQLKIKLKNIGPGDAKNVYVKLTGYLKGISFPDKSYFPTIPANGGIKEISIKIKGNIDLTSSEAVLKIEVVEPNFKVNIQGKQLRFATRKFNNPELLLAQYAIFENQSANPNNQIDINEIVDLKFAIQNIGQGDAENVKIDVNNNQNGVLFLGVVNGSELKRQNPEIDEISSGQYNTVTYRYFINSEFQDEELNFSINSKERTGRYGFVETKSFPINKKLEEMGYIRKVSIDDDYSNNRVVIEDIPDFEVDVDKNIPINNIKQTSTYAIVIGNEDYKSKQTGLSLEQNVPYALNDANVFALYCQKTLGIPKKQIKVLRNATSVEIKQALAWISNLSKLESGNAKLIFYYSGHGLPHEQTKEPYLIPVDVSGSNIEYGIKIEEVYKKLTKNSAKQVNVFLDACFSGGARNQGLVAMKGVRIKPKEKVVNGNIIVFSSSTGEESSAIYKEKQHGYFTYYLLKNLQENKGNSTLENMGNYIIQNVTKETALEGKIQTPQINVSYELGDYWKDWKLK